MGLDMYLEAELYVGGHYKHRNVTGGVDITLDAGNKKQHIKLEGKEVEKITTHVGYWCKANAIHSWFVRSTQNSMNNCERIYVSREQLMLLRTLAERCITAPPDECKELFPPESGFFFESTDIDEWYREDMRHTVATIDEALKMDEDWNIYYRASW